MRPCPRGVWLATFVEDTAMPPLVRLVPTLVLAAVCVTSSFGADWDRWPEEPIKVSPVEGVIESFWIPRVQAGRRWSIEGGRFSGYWDASFLHITGQPGATASMTRSYDMDLSDYQRLIVRLTPGESVRTTVTAVVDGRPQTIVSNAAGSNRILELAGPIRGRRLSRLTLTFTAEKPGEHSVEFRWIMLDKPGSRWTPPERPFEGMIVENAVGKFEPGLGIVLGADELRQMREVLKQPVYERTWQGDLDYAARQYQVDPASLLRQYSMYVPTRYGRKSDESIPTLQDGVMLALVGLITENEEYLRQAARHAIVLARIDYWMEGFVDRFPGYPWGHGGFATNTATIRAALLLDWTWHYLTPQGRNLVREAIRQKGLPKVWASRHAMANQGVRFNKGLILGRMALADSLADPELKQYVRACIDRINPKLFAIVRGDGSFSEGFDYGSSTLTSALISYQAASRCLGVPIQKLATPRMLPAMHYVLLARGDLNPTLAAFCAGPLGDNAFVSLCAPAGLLHSHDRRDHPTKQTWQWWPSAVNRTEYAAYGLHLLWAPGFRARPEPPRLPLFRSSAATRQRGDVPPLHGGSKTLDASKGPVNVGANQDYLRDVAGTTIAAWVKVSEGSLIARENCIYQSTGGTSSRLHLQVRGEGTPQQTGTLAAYMRRVDSDETASLYSTSVIPFDRWAHVAHSVDYIGGKYHFYINGSKAGSGSTGLSFGRSQNSPTPQNWVGAGAGGKNFPGLIDDVRVYNRTLSADEVRSLAVPQRGDPAGAKSGLVLHYQFEGTGTKETDLARPDGTATPADDGVLMAGSGWVFMGNQDPLAPRWNFESGLWDGHGHSWKHKHSMTLRGWGERLLIMRDILPYSDARSAYTQKTKAYNVFSPAERDQSSASGRGGMVQVAEDLGPVAVVQSDNATAWSSGVQRAIRRAIMIRPNVMIVHDDALLTAGETGVQSWNSFAPWRIEGGNRCVSRVGKAAVRLHCVGPSLVKLTAGEDSVSDERDGVVPVYRAAFTSPAAKRHSLLTIIEAIGPGKSARPVIRVRESDQMIEVHSADRVVQILTARDKPTVGPLAGFASDGGLLFTVREEGRITHAGAFDANWLDTPEGRIKGKGFLRWPAAAGGSRKTNQGARQ